MPTLKPGQKYPTPTPGFGDRVFYESLLKQRQTSEMAQDWWVANDTLRPFMYFWPRFCSFGMLVVPSIKIRGCCLFTKRSRRSNQHCAHSSFQIDWLTGWPFYAQFGLFSFFFRSKWRCLNYGILSHKKAEKLLIIVTERKRQQRLGVTGASASKKSRSSSPPPPKKKKIKKEDGGASPVKSANI